MPSSAFQKCALDRKSTRLNSSHTIISYAVFCLKKKQQKRDQHRARAAAPLRDQRTPAVAHRSSDTSAPPRPSVSPRGRGSCVVPFFFFNLGAPPDFLLLPQRRLFPC